ncbi:MAG TPA: Stp1/IreP family PP2C-type Ser/Thr phosphatase [Rhodocyclaceae bacterium]|nr:Stp1/IreP family PP2C-type Ser/Thr phosphatase [Rhodocyclaceae bacterium]
MDLSSALEMVALSDKGMVRNNNEDSVLTNAQYGFAVLADGMGGYNAGEVASGMATALLGSELQRLLDGIRPDHRAAGGGLVGETLLHDQIIRANAAIHGAAQTQPQYSGMGTTLVATLFTDNLLIAAHIGDSRLYRARGEDFQVITRDHSLLQEQIDGGIITPEEARYSVNRNLVTRALGIDPEVEPEIHVHEVQPGDIYLLCSDGLNDMVEDSEIAMTVQMLSANLAVCADQLVQMANDNGGRDNVSVILVKVKKVYPAPKPWWRKWLPGLGK